MALTVTPVQDEAYLLITVDDGRPAAARIRRVKQADWVAGPITIDRIDVDRDEHWVVIQEGALARWEARAGHTPARGSRVEVFLYGREPFTDSNAAIR